MQTLGKRNILTLPKVYFSYKVVYLVFFLQWPLITHVFLCLFFTPFDYTSSLSNFVHLQSSSLPLPCHLQPLSPTAVSAVLFIWLIMPHLMCCFTYIISFLWCLIQTQKHMGECMNEKTKYFYVCIFNVSKFDCDFGVTLIALIG